MPPTGHCRIRDWLARIRWQRGQVKPDLPPGRPGEQGTEQCVEILEVSVAVVSHAPGGSGLGQRGIEVGVRRSAQALLDAETLALSSGADKQRPERELPHKTVSPYRLLERQPG